MIDFHDLTFEQALSFIPPGVELVFLVKLKPSGWRASLEGPVKGRGKVWGFSQASTPGLAVIAALEARLNPQPSPVRATPKPSLSITLADLGL